MKLTQFAIERSLVVIIVIVLLVFSGITSYNKMPRAEDPGFVIRVALILTYFPGASPERVENLVTDKLEKSIQEMPELDYIKSESKSGVSVIYVSIKEKYKNLRPIWDSLRRKVDKVRPELPNGVSGPYVNDEFGDVFGTVLTIRGDGYNYAELKDIADDLRDDLLRIDEVAKVEIYGNQEERIFVEFDNNKLAEFGLSPYQLKQILESKNIIIPGGDITVDKEKIIIEPSGNLQSVDELKTAIINIPGRKGVVYLQDLANIYRDYIDPPNDMMHLNGDKCIGLAISLRDGGNIIFLGEKVKETLNKVKSLYPHGIDFDIALFQPDIVNKKINDFAESLIQAVIIVVIVMLISLGYRTGLIVASLIPVVVLITFCIMFNIGIWLDQISLAALIIALGILVDNSIVISESIMVQVQEGKEVIKAALNSTKELTFPLLITTLSISCAFLPIFLAESAVGEYCAPLFKVVSITLLTSLLLSITMVPILCCLFVKPKKIKENKGNYDSVIYKSYRSLLVSSLKHPFVLVFIMITAFIIALNAFNFVPKLFFPDSDRPLFSIECELPIGTPIQRTEEVVKDIENYLKQNFLVNNSRQNGILEWSTYIGKGAPRYVLSYAPETSSPEYAVIIANTTSLKDNLAIVKKVDEYCFNKFPDLKATVEPLIMGIPYDAPIEIRVSGKNTDILFAIVNKIKKKLATIKGTKNISDDWGKYTKKFLVEIDPDRAFRAGITNQDIAISLQTSLSGFEVTQYREDDKIIPVTLRAEKKYRNNFSQLEDLNVYIQATGESIPLKQVANIIPVWQPAKILRRDRLRTVTVQAELEPGYTSSVINSQITPWLEEESKHWGLGYYWELGGETEESDKANKSIEDKLPIAALVIVLLLIIQFNSIKKTLIILCTVPLGFIGVVVGLLLCHSYFGFITLLGVIALSGIVINNSVVLIERINIEINENKIEPTHAIVIAAQRRLRPIFLTASSTIGGLIPLWIGGGPMWEPMAISIIFGLMFATTLTLGVIPTLYSIFYGIKYNNDYIYDKSILK
ncbi:MAG: efflux RND transporter permease subunit [Vampirovibrionia bacterium]